MKILNAIFRVFKYAAIVALVFGVVLSIDVMNTNIQNIATSVVMLSTDIDDLKDQNKLNQKVISYVYDNLKELKQAGNVDTEKMIKGSMFVSGLFGLGSGTVVKKTADNMYILSCYHVIAELIEMQKNGVNIPATVGYVKDNSQGNTGGSVMYAADIVKADQENDLVLLKTFIVDDDVEVIDLASKAPELGDIVYSVGNSLGVLRTISRGILSNHKEGFYFSDNTITFGNSGGTLYNADAELIGIPSNVMGYPLECGFVPESGLGMSIDLLRIKEFLKGEL